MTNLISHWAAEEIKSKLGKGGGVGFVFHATDPETLAVMLVEQARERGGDALWSIGPIFASPIFYRGDVIGAHLVTPVPAKEWAGSHSGIRKFRERGYLPSLKLASEAGLTHLGLGALVPFATAHGVWGRENYSGSLTTGHAATVAMLWHMVQALGKEVAFEPRAMRYGIFGAAGSIGANVSRWLRHNGVARFILVDRPERHRQLLSLAGELECSGAAVECMTGDPLGLPPFDIGIVATSSLEPWIGEELLAKAPIWLDDSHPRAATLEAEQALKDEVLYLECFLRGPQGLCQVFPFRLPTSRDCYSCFAEAFVCWRMGLKHDFVVGPATLEHIALMDRMLPEHGFQPGPFTGKNGDPISGRALANVNQRLAGNSRAGRLYPSLA